MGFTKTNHCCKPKTASNEQAQDGPVMQWIQRALYPAIKRRDNELADQIEDIRINYGTRIHALEQQVSELKNPTGTPVCNQDPGDGTGGPMESNETDYVPEECD